MKDNTPELHRTKIPDRLDRHYQGSRNALLLLILLTGAAKYDEKELACS